MTAPVDKTTFCRICEPMCGMIATVSDGRLLRLRPDPAHPLSKGYACPKGIAFSDIVNDDDRVLHPLRRRPDGGFDRVSWDSAMSEIIARLRKVHTEHGGESIGGYLGNPSVFNTGLMIWSGLFFQMLGSPHIYSSNSQDANNRYAASHFLYGNALAVPIPDIERVELLVVVGANPVVSHGSLMSTPRVRDKLVGIRRRGGRVVVIDPRRTETAREFDWMPIRPDTDALLMLSLINVMFAEGLVDLRAVAAKATGVAAIEKLSAPYPPEATEERTGVPAATARKLARDLAGTSRAAVYGRVGTCLGRNGTLTTALLDIVNLLAGNLDSVGGSMFGTMGFPAERAIARAMQRSGGFGWGARTSRIGGFPQVAGQAPASLMAKEITTPGPGQLRALFLCAGNPVLSVPNGAELAKALGQTDLCVSFDLYRNETNANADFILPAPSMYERPDHVLMFQSLYTTPFKQATDPVIAPMGESRAEWQVFNELAGGLADLSPKMRAMAFVDRVSRRLGRPVDPQRVIDGLIRMGQGGDRFGIRRRGLNLARLRAEPSGVVVAEHLRPGRLRTVVTHRGRKVKLDAPELVEECGRLDLDEPADLPLLLIGMREVRSENTWQHNSPMLLRGGRSHTARMHPDDADARGVTDGDIVSVRSAHGEIVLPITVTADISPGVVAIPHGWGHNGSGGWTRANDAARADSGSGGANVNQLISSDPADLERLAGMARMNGVPIEVIAHARPS